MAKGKKIFDLLNRPPQGFVREIVMNTSDPIELAKVEEYFDAVAFYKRELKERLELSKN